MNETGKTVFLSYASQDAEAARRICEALRSGGVEVWFDQEGGLEHGDEWDAKIRRQIKECVLFIPLISANTQARHEGYFRIEWDLAAERAQGIASGVPFILPVVIDDTREPDALVPDRFRKVQWTRLRNGDVPPEVRTRFLKLWSHRTGVLSHEADVGWGRPTPPSLPEVGRPLRGRLGWIAAAVATVIVVGVFSWRQLQQEPAAARRSAPPTPAVTTSSEADQLVTRADALVEKINYTRDNLAAAEDLTRKATEVAADSAHAWATRAYVQSCYLLRGWDVSEKRRQDAESFANRALTFDPREAEAMLALTVLHNTQRAYAQAEGVARRAIAVRPDDPRLFRVLAVAIAGQGRTEEALALRQDNVKRFSRDALTHYDLAISRNGAGNFAGAWDSLDAALAVQPFASAQLLKVRLLASWKGDLAAARALLEQIPPEDRTEIRAVGIAMWLGLLERRLDHVQAAAALTTQNYLIDNVTAANGPKALALALALHFAGKEALAKQQWQAAEAVLRQRLRDQSNDSRASAYLAVTLVWLGRTDEAARQIAPFEATAREQPALVASALLAQYYASLGDAAKAVPFLRSALNKSPDFTNRTLALDPWWDKLRGQPEFEALLAEARQRSEASGQRPDPSGPSAARTLDLAPAKSIAVLAFANLSDDKENEYFSDGISEELLTVLRKIPGLRVAARMSAFSFKGKSATALER